MSLSLSLVIPVYNESESLQELVDRSVKALQATGRSFEVIVVNDGSRDTTNQVLNDLAISRPWLRVLHLRKNYGQTAAIAAGVAYAAGETIILSDGDLENYPEDIPMLLKKLDEGYDVVSGWRKERWKGQQFTRRWPSEAANALISRISGLKLHDYGCTLKAYRAEVIKGIRMYGDMHRFIPAYAAWQGARVAELPVRYTPRKHGKSKYGFNRTFKVVLDLVALKFMTKYFNKPMHFFGAMGLASIFLGLIAGAFAVYFKISTAYHKDFIQTPLPVLMALFVILGAVFVLMGLLAEMLVRTYHESQNKPTHEVRDKKNFV